jgi:fibro-slime domain-containing protein
VTHLHVRRHLVLLVAIPLTSAACGNGTIQGGPGDGTDAGGSGVGTGGNPNPNPNPGQQCGVLKATIRDFKIEHPDFEEPDGNSDVSYPGLVKADLGADNTPDYAPPGPVRPHTAGPEPFKQWYHDVPAVNIAIPRDIALTSDGTKSSYSSSAFFPIDNQGWGNEGLPHNYHFTTEVHTTFEYKGGETFSFTGDDDLWLFINRKLAIDLGGLHPPLSASVDLDQKAAELGIAKGNTYRMDIFHAERHTTASNFHVETTIDCFIIP